jgi:hypothetical protein
VKNEVLKYLLEWSFQAIQEQHPGRETLWGPDGHCGMCNHKDGEFPKGQLVRDHCHFTQLFRGYLCTTCNNHEGQNQSIKWFAWRIAAPYLAEGKRVMFSPGRPVSDFYRAAEGIQNIKMTDLLSVSQMMGFKS